MSDRETWDIYFQDIFIEFKAPKDRDVHKTESNVRYRVPMWVPVVEFGDKVNKAVLDLEQCTGIYFERNHFTVYVPDEIILSQCTPGAQLLRAPAPLNLCRDKGIEIDDVCEGVIEPTQDCPCPCLYRGGVQWNHFVVTTPDLAVFKHELLSMKLNDRNLWGSEYGSCLTSDATYLNN